MNELVKMLKGDETKAKWIQNISNGICNEEVAEKGPPVSAAGIKTFKKIIDFECLTKFIRLCVIDVT